MDVSCPNGRCRRCGSPLERAARLAGKPLRWSCSNVACGSERKQPHWTCLVNLDIEGKLLGKDGDR